MPVADARVDAYIEAAQPFARPLLTHMRACFHHAAPAVVETMKWSRPFFVIDGVILGHMAAFKQHCALSLWGSEASAIVAGAGVASEGAMGNFGRLTSIGDLPAKGELKEMIRAAAAAILAGRRTQSIERPKRKLATAAVAVPPALAAALQSHPLAAAAFQRMSPSGRREYAEWIGEAKTGGTRDRRVAQAVEMIGQGKPRHWKYAKSA